MDWDWTALATALRDRRKTLHLTQGELANQAGIHTGTIKDYEAGKTYTRMPKSWIHLERALGWSPGSARAVLSGGSPTLAPAASDDEERGEERYEIEAVSEDESAAKFRSDVFDAFVIAAPDTPASAIKEIADRLLDAARNYGYGTPRRRHERHTQDGPGS